MTNFVQLHILTSYPPSNLNRDDLGRPKTAVMGGCQRLRVSSQSLKRAWRTSEVFAEGLQDNIGTRTKEMGQRIFEKLKAGGMEEAKAEKAAIAIAGQFGKVKTRDKKSKIITVATEQIAHFSPLEIKRIDDLIQVLIAEDRHEPKKEELQLLTRETRAVDMAMFGRMLADNPGFNVNAAVQVAHAITVHKVAIEDDYFTAVDDLNRGNEDVGAGHVGESEFGAGVFYLYVCINRDLLHDNLSQDDELTQRTLRRLVESALTVSPTGKQNSFASRAYASYALVETGTQQPRSLSVAFLKPVSGQDILQDAVQQFETTRNNMAQVYGQTWSDARHFNAVRGEGTLNDVLDFASALQS